MRIKFNKYGVRNNWLTRQRTWYPIVSGVVFGQFLSKTIVDPSVALITASILSFLAILAFFLNKYASFE